MLKIWQSFDRLIFNMEIPIPEKDGLYIETGPWYTACIEFSMLDRTQTVCADMDGLVQERHNSSANTLELCLSCINPLILSFDFSKVKMF